MIGRSRDLCRLHWDQARQERETEDGAKLGHWVVVLAKVDRGQTYNRFNDGKVDPQGRLWAGLCCAQWLNINQKSFIWTLLGSERSDFELIFIVVVFS